MYQHRAFRAHSGASYHRPVRGTNGPRRYASGGGSSDGAHRGSYRATRSRRNTHLSSTIPRHKYIKKAIETQVHAPTLISSTQFHDMDLDPRLIDNLVKRGYTTPTPIQEQSIPHTLTGIDIVGVAQTGTGKTGAFAIPLINRIVRGTTKKVLVIVPTRELAQQIQQEIGLFARPSFDIRTGIAIGGGYMLQQIRQLARNPQFVIGTPGRLKDFVERGIIEMKRFDTVVLDEVDRMVDMGFIKDITALLAQLPTHRHSLFFSATVTKEVELTIQRFASNPKIVTISAQSSSDMVDQDIVEIPKSSTKLQVLESLLSQEHLQKVLVFARTKRGAEHLSNNLYTKNFRVSCIHGDKPQRKREQAIRLFQDNHIDILIATDVAARGLDIDDITHVINYDEPATYADYIHRIGRTGRANKKGYALTFVQ